MIFFLKKIKMMNDYILHIGLFLVLIFCLKFSYSLGYRNALKYAISHLDDVIRKYDLHFSENNNER